MDEMDVLWPKEKLQKIFSNETLPVTTGHASGDGCLMNSCRLCGGCNNLHCICKTYTSEGTEERYDQLLFDCFGVRVFHTDGLICECCIRQLRNTRRFKALVIAAFAKAPSDMFTNHSKMGIGESYTRNTKTSKTSHVELIKKTTRTIIDNKKKRERKSIFNPNVQPKRINIACTSCKQRYPMIMPFDGWKNFICSRCKKTTAQRNTISRTRTNMMVPNLIRELRGKSRLFSIPQKPSQLLRKDSRLDDSNIRLSKRPRRFASTSLTTRILSVHENKLDYICGICGKDLKSQNLLNKHMRMHAGQPVYQCDVCMKSFTGKNTFQMHYLTHGK